MKHATTKNRTTESHNKVATFSPLTKSMFILPSVRIYCILTRRQKRNLMLHRTAVNTTSNNQGVNEELRYVMDESIKEGYQRTRLSFKCSICSKQYKEKKNVDCNAN
jgi:hypothetical protein